MYLWKYWRESRFTFAAGMALVGLLLWGVLKIPVGYPGAATRKAVLERLRTVCLALPETTERLSHGSPSFLCGTRSAS